MLGRLEHALRLTLEAEPLLRTLARAGHQRQPAQSMEDWLQDLQDRQAIDARQRELLSEYDAALTAAIAVDDFEPAGMARSATGDQAA